MYRNSPRTLPLPVMDRPEMVWPCPSKVPPKVGMGVKSVPVRSISASRRTVFPWDQLSRVQFSASWTRSSAVRTKTVSPPSAARAAGAARDASSAAARRRLRHL